MSKEEVQSNVVVKLKVEVFDKDGNLKAIREKDNDKILANFGKWLAGIFRPSSSAVELVSGIVDITGASFSIRTYANPSLTFVYNYGDVGTNETQGQIGTGTTAPLESDFKLQTLFQSAVNINANGVYSGGIISFAFSVPISSSATITEAGVIVRWKNSAGTDIQIMIFRDTFGGLSVVLGDTVTCTYTIVL